MARANNYDYIVAGGGTAGCVLASRLSEDPEVRVLQLEVGAMDGPAPMRVPNAWPTSGGTEVDWGFTTVPQTALGGTVLPVPRGKALGWSSSINAMAYLRAHRSRYDQWATDGAEGWSYADLLPYFRRSETVEGREPDLRGTDGPMRIETVLDRHPEAAACLAASAECGHPITEDLNGSQQEGSLLVRAQRRRRDASERGGRLPAAGAEPAEPHRLLADHPIGGVVYSAPDPPPPGDNNHFDTVAALRSDPGLAAPDFQLLFSNVPIGQPGVPSSRKAPARGPQTLQLVIAAAALSAALTYPTASYAPGAADNERRQLPGRYYRLSPT